MKKSMVSLVALSLLMVAVLAGCVKETVPEVTEESVTEDSVSLSNKKVGICIYQFSDTFMSLFRDKLEKDLVDKGFSQSNITVYDSYNDPELQISQVIKMIESGVDILIINPVSGATAETITDMAVAANIPLVYMNREPVAQDEARWEENGWAVTYVGCDARQSGTYQGEIITGLGEDVVDVNGDGVIQYMMIEGDPENVDSKIRTEYSVKALEEAGFTLECVADEVGNFHRDTAHQLVNKALVAGDNIEVVLCNNDDMALGAKDALEEAGKTVGKDVFVVGVDGLEEALLCVIDGKLTGTVFNDYNAQALSTAEAAERFLLGETNDYYIDCRYVKVTSENAEKIYAGLKE